MNIAVFIPFIIVFLLIIFSIFSNSKNKININYEKINNKDIEKYKNLILNNELLAKYRKSYKKCQIIGGIIWIIFILVGIILLVTKGIFIIHVLAILGLFVFILIPNIASTKYNKVYKNEIIKNLMLANNMEYYPDQGMSIEDYRYAKFEYFDRYHSNDLIKGKVNNIDYILADVHTEDRYEDSDGDTHYRTIFRGSVSTLKMPKNLNSFIYIVNNKSVAFSKKYLINIDNEEFEKIFDIYSDNDVLAMRILTPDVTNSILDLTNETGIHTEIKIFNNIIYFRFYTGDLFSPSINDIDKEATNIAFYFKLIEGINIIMKNILDVIEEVEL
ncbi:MAG: DUF3137 domain-containing protein [Firmicutes bacterium]|nr:DUF3137 domain-containing protein [Bacillota bacterium]